MANPPSPSANQAVARLVPLIREKRPLVYCLSNSVTAQFVANVLYAVGASPVFCIDPLEAEDMATQADALVVNLGTLDSQQRQAIDRAVVKAKRWVLDPVGIQGIHSRRRLAQKLLQQKPSIVRANASEIIALDPEGSTALGTGVDSGHDGLQAAPVAKHLATEQTSTTFALTGRTDFVAGQHGDGTTRMVQLSGGDPLMAKVTGMGCCASALCGAFLAVVEDTSATSRFEATVAALHLASAAGGHAGANQSTKGPASFQTNFIDALWRVSAK